MFAWLANRALQILSPLIPLFRSQADQKALRLFELILTAGRDHQLFVYLAQIGRVLLLRPDLRIVQKF